GPAYRRHGAPPIATHSLPHTALFRSLLAPPAGEKVVLGLDPGYRTGVKAAVVSKTGAVLDTDTLYLHQEERFAAALKRLVEAHRSAEHTSELQSRGNLVCRLLLAKNQ